MCSIYTSRGLCVCKSWLYPTQPVGDPLLSVPAMTESFMVFCLVVFFKLAVDANIPIAERVSVEMVDVLYLKTFNAHYREDTDISNAVLNYRPSAFGLKSLGFL